MRPQTLKKKDLNVSKQKVGKAIRREKDKIKSHAREARGHHGLAWISCSVHLCFPPSFLGSLFLSLQTSRRLFLLLHYPLLFWGGLSLNVSTQKCTSTLCSPSLSPPYSLREQYFTLFFVFSLAADTHTNRHLHSHYLSPSALFTLSPLFSWFCPLKTRQSSLLSSLCRLHWRCPSVLLLLEGAFLPPTFRPSHTRP